MTLKNRKPGRKSPSDEASGKHKKESEEKMTNTVLIEQSAKNIKLAEAIVLAVLFCSIAAGLGGMYLSLALGIAMFIIAGIALVGFMAVRVWRWWMHG